MTDTAEAWSDETELETMYTNDDNTPPSREITTDLQRRMSDHSLLEQSGNTSDNNSSSRNNPLPVSIIHNITKVQAN